MSFYKKQFNNEKGKKHSLALLFVVFTFMAIGFSHSALYAQGPGFDPDVEDVPLDGGASLLLGGTAAYVVKKWRDKRGKDSSEDIV